MKRFFGEIVAIDHHGRPSFSDLQNFFVLDPHVIPTAQGPQGGPLQLIEEVLGGDSNQKP